MIIARVIGNVVATRKDENLVGTKLLVVKRIPVGNQMPQDTDPFVAVDTVGAGVGEEVLVVLGSSARATPSVPGDAPIDASVIGIIDSIETDHQE